LDTLEHTATKGVRVVVDALGGEFGLFHQLADAGAYISHMAPIGEQ
jgi:hypothetical protein